MALALLLTACSKDIDHQVLYTDATFKEFGDKLDIFNGSGALSSIRSLSFIFFGRKDSGMARQVFVSMVQNTPIW